MTTSTLTVTDFILARIEEDERSVDVPDWFCTDSARGEGWGSRGDECPACGCYMFDGTEVATEDAWEMHMADRHGRVLAQCAALRDVVRFCGHLPNVYARCVLQPLASIWSDHPDWRGEWQ